MILPTPSVDMSERNSKKCLKYRISKSTIKDIYFLWEQNRIRKDDLECLILELR